MERTRMILQYIRRNIPLGIGLGILLFLILFTADRFFFHRCQGGSLPVGCAGQRGPDVGLLQSDRA